MNDTNDTSLSCDSEILIRRARPEDLTAITTLWRDMMAYHEQFDGRFRLEEQAPDKYHKYLDDLLNNIDCLILAAESPELGVVGYTLGMILDNPAVFILPRYGFIAEMMVNPIVRRQGIGALMHDRALKWFQRKGVSVVQLNVSTINPAGQAFWRNIGYRDFLHVLWLDLPPSEQPHD